MYLIPDKLKTKAHIVLATFYSIAVFIYIVVLFYYPEGDMFGIFLGLICMGNALIFLSNTFYYTYCFDRFDQKYYFLFPMKKSKGITLEILYQLKSYRNISILFVNTVFLFLMVSGTGNNAFLVFLLMLTQYLCIIVLLVLVKNLEFEHRRRVKLIGSISVYVNLITVFAVSPITLLSVPGNYSPLHKSLYFMNITSLISFVALVIVMFFIFQSAKKWKLG